MRYCRSPTRNRNTRSGTVHINNRPSQKRVMTRFFVSSHFCEVWLNSADEQRNILSAEAETVAHRMPDAALFARFVGDVIEIAVRIRVLVVDRRWQHAAAQDHDTRDH